MQSRMIIAETWEKVATLLKELGIKKKEHLWGKIEDCRATSDHMRREIARVIAHPLPDRAKSGELLTFLAEIEVEIDKIQSSRNQLQSINTGIIGSFFNHPRFKNYYADKLSLETRNHVASLALLRAADTFDPTKGGTFSTYAFGWIRSFISKEAEGGKKHTHLSLDAPTHSTAEESGGLLHTIADKKAMSPDAQSQQHSLYEQLQSVLEEMHPTLRRALELVHGLGSDTGYSHEETAKIMSGESLRTIKHQKEITASKVREYIKQAKRIIAHAMRESYERENKK